MLPKPYWQDSVRTLYNTDAVNGLRSLDTESIQCVVTSPPYWGLRKYAGEQDLIWGNVDHCEHEWQTKQVLNIGAPGGPKQASVRGSTNLSATADTCSLCGAWRGAYGLEPTVQMYVDHTVEILREIRRVLRKDGVVFWNVGDSYALGKGTCHNPGGNTSSFNVHLKENNVHPLDRGNKSTLEIQGLKPKDLYLIPFRVWYLIRSRVVGQRYWLHRS